MSRRRTQRFLWCVLISSAWMLATARPVAAECTGMDPWPSFTEAAPSATRIVIGEVVESFSDDSADNAVHFRVRVDEVLRGSSRSSLELRDVRSGVPLKICPDSILRVRVGDVLAFAFDARVSNSPEPVLAVAWIRGRPHEFLLPGAERLTLAQVRALAGLPATDTVASYFADDSGDRPAVLFLGLFGTVTVLLVRRRPRQHH